MQSPAKATLANLHSKFKPALMAFFLRRVWSRSEAEDLTQEVFVRLTKGSSTQMKHADAYIFQVAANLLRDRARAAQVRTSYLSGLAAHEIENIDTLDPHRIAESREALSIFIAALDSLPPRTREIFLLFRYENIGQRAIAQSFGISVSAVEKHIHRALSKLIESLGEI